MTNESINQIYNVCKIKFIVNGEDYDGYDSYPENERESIISHVTRIRFTIPYNDRNNVDKIRAMAEDLFRNKIINGGINIPGIELPRRRKSVDIEVLKCWRQINVKDTIKLIRLDKPIVIDI